MRWRQVTQAAELGEPSDGPPPVRVARVLAALVLSQVSQSPTAPTQALIPTRTRTSAELPSSPAQLALWVWATRLSADGSYFLLSYSTVPGILMLLTRCAVAVVLLVRGWRVRPPPISPLISHRPRARLAGRRPPAPPQRALALRWRPCPHNNPREEKASAPRARLAAASLWVCGPSPRQVCEGRAPRRFVVGAAAAVGAWLLAPALAAAAANSGLVPFWRAQQVVGAVHMSCQISVLFGIVLVDWPWARGRSRGVWQLPGVPHLQMGGGRYEDIR